MEFYNKIMRLFWLAGAIVTFAIVTYFCFTEGYKTWVYYYVFTVICLMMYFAKTWMMKRMKKHLEYLEDKKKNGN